MARQADMRSGLERSHCSLERWTDHSLIHPRFFPASSPHHVAILLKSSSAKRLPPRPSLSLSLPPSFSRTPASLDLLRQLIETLSPAFLIHLITPPPPEDASQGDSGGDEYGVQSVAELAAALQDIALFDSRRVLEYSRSEGRQALARALACDAHLEVFLGSLPDDAEGPGMSAVQQEGEESEKPDKNEYEGPAAQYRGDIERLRRACGLVILLALPPLPGASALRSTAERAAQAQVNEVLSHYRANPPGVRLVDSRAQHSDVRAAWTDAAAQVREFRQGWR